MPSAAGLLAGSLVIAWSDPVFARLDAVDEREARPAFAALTLGAGS